MAGIVARKTYQVLIQHYDGLKTWRVVVAPIMEPSSQAEVAGPFKTMKLARIAVDQMFPNLTWANGHKGYTVVESECE